MEKLRRRWLVALAALTLEKAAEMPVFGGGRGDGLRDAAEAYRVFLLELARGEKSDEALKDLLEEAEVRLNVAYEGAKAP